TKGSCAARGHVEARQVRSVDPSDPGDAHRGVLREDAEQRCPEHEGNESCRGDGRRVGVPQRDRPGRDDGCEPGSGGPPRGTLGSVEMESRGGEQCCGDGDGDREPGEPGRRRESDDDGGRPGERGPERGADRAEYPQPVLGECFGHCWSGTCRLARSRSSAKSTSIAYRSEMSTGRTLSPECSIASSMPRSK